jgi:hypothetical protein
MESRSSLVAMTVRVVILTFDYFLRVVLFWLGNGMLEWAEAGVHWFADCVCKSHALSSGQRLVQRCGHLQRDVWSLEHCSSHRSSTGDFINIAAECRNRDLRWWRWYVLPCQFSYLSRVILFWLGYRMLEWAEIALVIACASLMPCTATGGVYSTSADIFNVTSGAWSNAALSVGRTDLAAPSLPNLGVAIFAGGDGTYCPIDLSYSSCVVLF